MISFLTSIKCWSHWKKKTVSALQHNQMKGFDYLAPEGFYDAIVAYGLPTAIIDLDRAAQHNTRCFPRTAFGIADTIIVNGVTKQGGPLSPLKSTLTTSLGNLYAHDTARNHPGTLVLSSKSHATGDPHLPDDQLQLPVVMVEAMDDSYIFMTQLKTLQNFCLMLKQFQFTYGWYTQWSKTQAWILAPPPDTPDSVLMPSITDTPDTDPWQVTWHRVPLICDQLEFLRTKVNDPSARYEHLCDYIENFRFPKFTLRPPITLLRKIVNQIIVSKCRALLTLQPIKHTDAIRLDDAIKMKIHQLAGLPYAPCSHILNLPIPLHGLGCISIARLNSAITIEGTIHNLNHHVKSYRTMARITYADWTCAINNCKDPLDSAGLAK